MSGWGGRAGRRGRAGAANTWDDAHAALKRLDYQKAEEGLGAIRDSPEWR